MRVAVVTRSIPVHGGGGMEKVSWDLMKHWSSTCIEVVCFTTPFDKEPNAPFLVKALQGRPGQYSRQWARALDEIDWSEFDVILSISAGAHTLVGRGPLPPVVMQAHGTSLDEIRTKIALRSPKALASSVKNLTGFLKDVKVYRKYACVVAVGPSVIDSLKHYPKWSKPRRIELIPNGVKRGPKALDNTHPSPSSTILFAGRLKFEKGVDLLIRALLDLPSSLLQIAGTGPDREAFEQLAGELHLQDRVVFLGPLDEDQLRQHMRAAGVVVAPSRRREGLPMVVLESLAEQTPVVTTAQVVESFGKDRPSGLHSAQAEPRKLASAISKALEVQAPVELPSTYSLEASADRYVTLFESLRGK